MRRFLTGRFLALLLTTASAVALASPMAHAQLVGELKANIPFKFTAGSTTFPAGSYIIRVLDITEPNELVVVQEGGNVEAVISTIAAQAKQPIKQSELVFNKMGDREFLSEVWPDQSGTGYQIEKTRAELKLEKSGAKRQPHRLPASRNAKRTS